MARVVFLGLNVVRVLSIVGLLLVFASSIIAMVTNIKAVNRFQANRIANPSDAILNCDYIEGSTVPNQPAGLFWAVVASLLIIFQVIILIMSELRWPAVFFDNFFPVLGNDFGLGALGIFQALIGAQILSLHVVDEFTLVSAFFLFSIGCLNMLLGLVFREGAKSKRSLRGEKKKGLIIGDIRPHVLDTAPQFQIPASAGAYPGAQEKSADDVAASFASWKSTDKAGYGFGRQGEKAAGLRGFLLQRPEESLPRYAAPTPTFAAAPESPARAPSPTPAAAPPRASRDYTPSAASSRSASRESRASTYSESSSFASPMSYRETIEIPDSPQAETPPPFAPSRYGGNPSAF
ncbi:hypothetical protein GGX14DRAFT_587996 [Mycena pura]|uniref:DUF7598 domain-containing protein n=1 Tax=Mycena pura TaxID=153505 RepID=A0AAD6UX09_9AGAR|nr:hypothetical protein GGX14DRAFT_587996 [Mycena pura]